MRQFTEIDKFFQKVTPFKFAARVSQGVAVTTWSRPVATRPDAHNLAIRLSADVQLDFKIKSGDKVALYQGEEEAVGVLKLVKDEGGNILRHVSRTSKAVTMRTSLRLSRHISIEDCEYEVQDGALFVILPKDFAAALLAQPSGEGPAAP